MSEQLVPSAENVDMTDEQIVAFTQRTRKTLVDDMTENGSKMPTDKGDRIVLLTALTDMDRTAVAKMKIGSAERQGNADRQAALVAARLIGQFGATPPFRRSETDVRTVRPAPSLDDEDLPPIQVLEGETETGLVTIEFDDFMSKMDKKARQMDDT